MKTINPELTLFELCETHNELIPVLTAQGFPGLATEAGRKGLGKSLTLRQAIEAKKKDLDTFLSLLENSMKREGWEDDVTLSSGRKPEDDRADVRVAGLLPCPVRIPLLEQFREAAKKLEARGVSVSSDLKAASTGIDWLKPYFEQGSEALPDIFLSAGFDLFFDDRQLGHFIENGVFDNPLKGRDLNGDFRDIDLEDPRGHYAMVSVVPSVFLINEAELNGRPAPRSWEDLLKPEWDNSVSLPVGDFDLFNAILVGLYSRFGDEGIGRLASVMHNALHPAQMLKPGQMENGKPAVTIVPWFFTRMIKPGMGMEAVWPEDGSILSPIFLMVKSGASENVKELARWFASKEVGEIFSLQGRFPSLHPEIDNNLPEKAPVYWPGWDFIYSHDMGALIDRLLGLFKQHGGVA